ncbi:ATP-binding cassette domain-containing protein [Labrys wisconsinensis]|uniref:Ribose transport system ATP-binding protein n=1 Tax=Labrys wisconsinensis TaxID=425677 RepID=A0ABU0J4S1_9HYPH|nr:ATP-binding cassette domain-containing protein [Labrys wisconsinensis]MDQ0469265.1 ribose transport system ATP-binding protein [Labrys wisconsinensis]
MAASGLSVSDSPAEASPAAAAPVVSLVGITKAFGPTLANCDVSLAIARGDVVGLVGGNGAGKSTLMRALCGVARPDSGTIAFGGEALSFDAYDTGQAQARGIRIVHQELSLCANLSVAENFFLEAPEAARPRPGWRAAYRGRARAALDAVFPGNGIDVDREVGQLPIGERQMVEIARAVATPGVRLVILDEPTSSLGLERSRQLRGFIHARAAEGLAFIFISHKLFEIIDVANRVAVLRNGRLIWEGETGRTTVPDLVRLMGGEAAAHDGRPHRARAAPGDVLVRLSGDVTAALGRDVELRRGEIVGLAGLEGSGQKVLLHNVFAPGRADSAGVRRLAPAAFVSGDRQREGVFPLWTVLANIGLARIAGGAGLELLSQTAEQAAARPAAERLRLDADRLASNILDLSGGNQQKALVARALACDAPIILLDDPTRGVDVAAKRDFYAVTRDIAEADRLVLWHSTEDLEFLECDRVLVFANGRIVRDLGPGEISEQAIVDASFTPADAGAPAAAAARHHDGSRAWAGRLVGAAPFLSLALVLAVMVLANPRTASVFGLDLLLMPAVPLVLVALGQMFVIGGSEIDLGAGAFAGLANVISATLLFDTPAFGLVALAGTLVLYGVLGAVIQLRRIPAIVVTLGASFIWTGLAYTLQPTPGGASPDWLTALFAWSVPGVPSSLLIIGLIAILALTIDRSPLGVTLRAFGNNPAAMARGGWPAPTYAAIRYVLAGLFGMAAGLSLTAINTASDFNAGSTYTLLGVAAAVIGGCSLIGGRISAPGVVAGAVTLSLIGALLGMLGVSSDFNAAVQGILLLAILAMRTAVAHGRDEE